MHGLAGIPLAQAPQTRKDHTGDQETRWCPDCGDYVILSTFQTMMADLGVARESTVVVSGIKCSSRPPYCMDCYGMHSIHGRVIATAAGIVTVREDLNVWVITGDSDALSIGGSHLTHAMRRNVNINILSFNNHVCGLTKGQYSPTSEQDKLTKSTPYGPLDMPFNPMALVFGAEAPFMARAVDPDRTQLTEVMNAAARYRGTALVEVYQNHPISNDEAFDALRGSESTNVLIRFCDGEPVVFGTEEQFYMVREPDGGLRVTEAATAAPERVVAHDAGRRDPSQAFALTQLTDHGVVRRAPIEIFRQVKRPVYDNPLRAQVVEARVEDPRDTLQTTMSGKIFWEII